ncbi:hypothetical protein D3C77_558490 [compost metagenome]
MHYVANSNSTSHQHSDPEKELKVDDLDCVEKQIAGGWVVYWRRHNKRIRKLRRDQPI